MQHIIKHKISNQADVLQRHSKHDAERRLKTLARGVRSGDVGNTEAHASQVYFRQLFGSSFSRKQSRIHNTALNYGYSIIRSALARNLVSYGFLTALGLHHRSEQNAFNLADDLLEPFRPIMDAYVLMHFPLDSEDRDLSRDDKACLVNILHSDVAINDCGSMSTKSTLPAASEAIVVSLSQRLNDKALTLTLPGLCDVE